MEMTILGIISDWRAVKSKSPAMHNRVLRLIGISGVYLPFMVQPERLGEAVRGVRALGLQGVNITVPYKEAVLPFLDECSDEGLSIGAVNTIAVDDDRLIGHNTDARGFQKALAGANFDPTGWSVLIFGAGGAAKAAAYALKQAGARRITMIGRDLGRTLATAKRLDVDGTIIAKLDDSLLNATDMVVNATPASDPDESADLAELAAGLKLSSCRLVYDLNYDRARNFWREMAQRHGASFEDGLFMLAHQARLSFQIWTGQDVDVREFAAALRGEA